jgi:hypothetical protein
MSVTQIRPTSTDTKKNVNISGAAPAFSVLDDAPAVDTTFAQGSVDNGFLELGFADNTPALTATTRIKGIRMQVRGSHDGVDIGHAETAQNYFRDNSTLKLGPVFAFTTSSVYTPGSFLVKVGGWNYSGPGGIALTQAALNRIQVAMHFRRSQGGQFIKISELYVDVDVNTRPVVDTVAVTGATGTTRPTVTHNFTDPDDDDQTRWQVMVYTQAATLLAGFNPGVTVPSYDSGVLIGSGNTHTLTSDLTNGTSYIAYVSAAQDWPGPEGSLWWSDWTVASSKSSVFTITLTPPPAPTLAVTQQLGIPHYRNMLNISLAGINMHETDTAEFESSVGFWQAGLNCQPLTINSTNPKSGLNAMRMTATAAGTMKAYSGGTITSRHVKPGTIISATLSFRAVATPRTVNCGLRFLDKSGAQVGADAFGPNQTDATTGYVTAVFLNQTVPATADSADVIAQVVSAGAGEIHQVDEAGLIFGPTATFTQGGYLQNGSVKVRGKTTSGAYVSRGPVGNFAHPQLYSAGYLTHNTDSFTARQANDSVTHTVLDRPPPEAPDNTTTGMIIWDVRVGPFSYLDIGYADGVATTEGSPRMFPAVAGINYTLSAWLWCIPNATARLGIIYVDEFNTQVGSTFLSTTANLTATEQKVSVAGTAPAGTVFARAVLEDTAGLPSLSYRLTMVRFRITSADDTPWPGQTFESDWYDIRGAAQALPQDGSDNFNVYDHEAAPGRTIMYSAQFLATTAGGLPIASAQSRFAQVYMTPPSQSVLKDPFQAENALVLMREPEEAESQDEDFLVFHATGRDGDPLTMSDWIGGQDGSLVVGYDDALKIYRMRQLSPAARPLLIQFADGGQKYIRPIGRKTDRIRSYLGRTTLDYLETKRP